MLPVKRNYKSSFENKMECRACKESEENQKHVLQECHELHKDESTTVSLEEIFDEEPVKLKITAKKIIEIMKKLEKINKITGKKKKKEKALTHGTDNEELQMLIDPIDQSVENQ